MPTFHTPEPIVATIDMAAGSVRVVASARTDTVVEVRPRNETSDADVQAAEQTRVEYAAGRLSVKAPKSWLRSLFGTGPAVEIRIELPEGSELDASAWADFTCEGRLGNVRIENAMGDIRLGSTARLRAKTSVGDVTVTRVEGHADVDTSAGTVRIGEVEGTAAVKTSSGNLTIGEVAGDVRLNTAYGDIDVARAAASVVAKTSAGSVRLDQVSRGSIVLDTAYGDVTVGVGKGTAAWLDVSSRSGNVRSELDASDAPTESDQTVEIRARTQYGDIIVRRA